MQFKHSRLRYWQSSGQRIGAEWNILKALLRRFGFRREPGVIEDCLFELIQRSDPVPGDPGNCRSARDVGGSGTAGFSEEFALFVAGTVYNMYWNR